ncbi:hypothetical protein GOBAR_AA39652 [Gossypium barbadense]|uniref:Uncharacterized protein n=1 Tax=Gossypium barbadense TaxID=3634 RepID=A0A2P5VQD7_GOSBA|nr:hypothetical protein GOBAR_AA39652 [Gossypium barbadense]
MKLQHELGKRAVVAKSVGPRVVGGHHQECPHRPPLGRLGETILGRGGSSAPLDHPHAKHARDAFWIHLPSRCSGLLLKVGLKVFGRALFGSLVETLREGDEFSRLDVWKIRLPSFSSRLRV